MLRVMWVILGLMVVTVPLAGCVIDEHNDHHWWGWHHP
jgi:hypothetical protein